MRSLASHANRQLHYDGARGVRYEICFRPTIYFVRSVCRCRYVHVGIEPKLAQRRAKLRTWKHDIQRVSGVGTTCLLTAAGDPFHERYRERADVRVTSYDSYDAPVGKACKLARVGRHASHITRAIHKTAFVGGSDYSDCCS